MTCDYDARDCDVRDCDVPACEVVLWVVVEGAGNLLERVPVGPVVASLLSEDVLEGVLRRLLGHHLSLRPSIGGPHTPPPPEQCIPAPTGTEILHTKSDVNPRRGAREWWGACSLYFVF
jgi:hypothetical protein